MILPRYRALPLCAAALLFCAAGSAEEHRFTREGFDALERHIGMSRTFEGAESDVFAWSESYMLRGYVEMYLATHDEEYLRRLVRVADAILETRDDRKAAREGRRAAPVWSLDGHYTVARLVLRDARGRDAVLLRSIRYAYNNQTVVTVTPGAEPVTFTLGHTNEWWQKHGPAQATYPNLSLDPSSPRYFERVVNDPGYVAEERFARAKDAPEPASFLLVALDLRRHKRPGDQLAPLGPTALVPGVVPYYGYLGPILAPMTRFASLVLKAPELRTRFGEAAERHLRAARESMDAYEACWRRGPGRDEGYYLLAEKGADFWCDGIMAPFNYLGSTGQVLANLWDWKHDRKTYDKLRRLANLLKHSCTPLPNGAYSFPYWSPVGFRGWSKRERLSVNTPAYGPTAVADDASHAANTVEFAVMCHERGIVFTREEMERFAKTFTLNLWRGDPKGLSLRVDGSGDLAADSVPGARWLDLCIFDPRILEMNRAIWQANGYDDDAYGHAIGGYARMFRWQEALKRP